jgi:putative flippase GtrA
MVFSFIIGFWLQKNISFKSSPLKGRIKLFRYLISALVFWALSYFIDKMFVEVCHIFPTIAFMMTYLITALLNFFAQRHLIFRGAERE